MQEQTKKTIMEQFNRLPKNLQTVILSTNLSEKLQHIFKKHNLRVDEAATLENEIALVFLGMEHPSNFPENLKEYVKLPENKVLMVARDVNDKIFAPVRSALLFAQKGQGKEPTQKKSGEIEKPKQEIPAKTQKRPQELRGVERTMPRDIEAAKRRQQGGIPQQQQPSKPMPPPGAFPRQAPKEPKLAPQNQEIPQKPRLDKLEEQTTNIPKEQKEFFESKGRYGGNDPYRESLE